MNLSPYDRRTRPRMTRRVLRGFDAAAFATARTGANLSVPDLARAANVGTATIYSWEAGTRTPQVDLLARAMKIIGAPIEHVVTIARTDRYPGDWRVIRGLTQPELAAAASIATTTLRGIERADIALTDANALRLSGLLHISVDEYRACHERARQRPPGTQV
ncbi:XRE family transcriptional regulator [Mycobacteroides abscessus subsp. massiliense]|nr:XRE family transcriptional regulator [Mycobacteroides abscessus subsp. massiliense]SKU13400.1 XRE family transcriptional regulator [Mycobacteroides abscessus subsp. massiliense]